MKTIEDEIRHILDYDSEETVALTFKCKARLVKNIVSTVNDYYASQPSDVSDEEIQRHIENNSRSEDGFPLMDEQAYYEGAKAMRDGKIKKGE